MENKICILIPYFGKLTNYFELWAYSASKNASIDFYIISDKANRKSVPNFPNLIFVESTLAELRMKFSNFFGFECCLSEPYKLCDFKPFYYVLYPDIISKYDYWGFSDIDLIFGDILSLIPADFYKYDVLFKLGHFSLIKNISKVNDLLIQNISSDVINGVFTSEKSFFFDEREYSRFNIARENNLNVFDGDNLIADIYSYSPVLRLVENYKTDQALLFQYNDGKLIGYERAGNKLKQKNYIYIHLQKRKMSNYAKSTTNFYINGYKFFNKSKKNINEVVKKYANKCFISKIRILINLRLKPKLRKVFH